MAEDQTQNKNDVVDALTFNEFDSPQFQPNRNAPLNDYYLNNPEFAHIPEDQVLQDMHKVMAPEVEYPKFEALARQADGYDAIKKAKSNLNDVERFRVQFPQFKDYPRDKIIDGIYKMRVADKKIDPTLVSRGEFAHHANPLPGPLNDLYNLWDSANATSSVAIDKFNESWTGGFPKWFSEEFEALMNTTPAFSIDSKTGQLKYETLQAGTEFKKLGAQVQDWINTAAPGFNFAWQKWHEILSAMNLTPEQQAEFAKVDEQRLANVPQSAAKTAGQIAGVGTDLVLNWPVYATLGPEAKIAGNLETLVKKTAGLVTIAHASAGGFHEAQEAHSENALVEGAFAGFSTAGLGYLYNSGAGRILTGLAQGIMAADPDELQKLFSGTPSDHSGFAGNVVLNVGLGLFIKGHVEEGLTELHGPTAEEMEAGAQPPISLEFAEKGHRPLTREDVLGGEEEGYPTKVPGLSPIRIVKRKERPVTLAGEQAGLTTAGEVTADPLQQRRATRQTTVEGEQGRRLVTGRVRLTGESLEDVVSGPEGERAKQETGEAPSILAMEERQVKRATGVRIGTQQVGVGYALSTQYVTPEVWEHVVKALHARDEGDIVKAQAEHDTAVSLMPDEQKTQYAKDFAKAVRGESDDIWTPKDPQSDEEPEEYAQYDEEDGIPRAKVAEPQEGGTVRRVRRGEMGSVINPAELILHAARKVGDIYDDYFRRGLFATQHRQEAAAINRPIDIRKQSDQWIRDELQVHQSINPWGTASRVRRNRWNKWTNPQLKQFIIDYENGRNPVVDPKDQGRVNHRLLRNRQIEQAAARAVRRMDVEPKDWFVRSMLSDNLGQLKKFDNWVTTWKAEHSGTHPSVEDALRAKTPNGNPLFRFKSFNPEDWMQAKLNTARNLLTRQDAFHTFREAGRAIPVKEPDEDFKKILVKHKWEIHSDPHGTKYYVEPETWHVMSRYFDEHSMLNIPVLKYAYKFAMLRKNVTGNILAWSLVHPKHIWEIHVSHAFAQMFSGVPAKEAWAAVTKLPKDELIDYFHEKIPRTQLSPEGVWWLDKVQRAGLTAGINAERQMTLEFGRNLAQFLRRGHGLLRGFDRTATFIGSRFLQNEWVQHQIFGEYIPRLKMLGFKLSVRRLLLEHPEYNQDHNEVEFSKALAKIGNEIDDRYGERNMSNLLWPRIAKELGIASTLSMGWTLGFLNVTGGTVKSFAGSTTRMQNIFRAVNDPKRRPVLDEKLKFYANYAASYLITGAMASLLYGYSRGKKFEPKDLVYPIIGENDAFPLDDPHHWTRSRPVEFQSELFTLAEHINKEGGMLDHPVMAPLYGTGSFLENKVSPGLKDLWDALAVQHDFFGKDIGGRPLEPEGQKIMDKLSYILFNDSTPIVVKQQIENRVGHPAPTNFVEGVQSLASLDTIPALLGYSRAPEYVYRSGFENAVVNAYSYGRSRVRTEEMIEKSNWLNEFRLAIRTGNDEKAQDALQVLEDRFQIKPAEVKKAAKEGLRAESAAMYMFFHGDFSKEEQKKLLEKASPQEKAEWLEKATKAERGVLAQLGVE